MAAESNPVRQEYDQLAPHYDRRWRFYIDATLNAVVEGLALCGEEAILDVPCGTGELARRLLAHWPGLQITGADLSPAMLEAARSKDDLRRVAWVEADVADLPLPDRAFDWVVCANSFHYFPAPERALAELRRVLRLGASLVLVDWCDDYLSCKLCSLWLRWTDPAFHRTYSLRGCRQLLDRAGFTIARAERFRVTRLWGLMRVVCRAGSI
jgi:ubiquinone/menaquinone biosynthesis C-methylase UbiE